MSKATQVSQKRLPKSQRPPATSVTAFQGITRRATQRSEMASDSTNQLVTLARRWRKRRTAKHTSVLPTSVLSTRAPSRHPVRARSARGPPPAAAFPIRGDPWLGPRGSAGPTPPEEGSAPGAAAASADEKLPEGATGPLAAGAVRGWEGSRPRGHLCPSRPPAASVSPAAGGGASCLGATHRAGCPGPPARRLAAAPSRRR